MALFHNLGVKRHGCLCDIPRYASAQPLVLLDLVENCSFLTGLLPGMPAFLVGWKEAIKDSELPYREAKASIGNLRQCPLIYERFVDGHELTCCARLQGKQDYNEASLPTLQE